MTGLYPLGHGAISNDLPIRHDVTSIGHVLSDAGYDTNYIGKWHLAGIPRDQIVSRGVGRLGFSGWKVNNCSHSYSDASYYDEDDRFHEVEGYEPESQTDLAIDYIRQERESPWAMVLSWGPPHEPYSDVPQEFLELYEGAELSLRENLRVPVQDRADRSWTEAEVRENLRGYYAHITALDAQFGRLLEALRESGQEEDTIIVYTSDHGDMLGSQGFNNKQLPFDEAVRVPLMVSWAGRTFEGVSKELLGLVDLPVSLMGLMGLSFPGRTDGKDLSPLFVDPIERGLSECYLFDYIPAHQASDRGGESWRAIRTKRYTLAISPDDSDWLLYDNQEDPFQLRNLVDSEEHAGLREDLGERLRTLVAANDRLLSGDDFVRFFGLTEEWNRSQGYFGLPLLK